MRNFIRLSNVFTFFILSVSWLIAQPLGGYDIYVVNVATGIPTQVTSSPADEFNPSFSPNSKKIVYDFLLGAVHDLYITDTKTGMSSPLMGGTGGCDASWSPDGDWIAFDRSPAGDNSIYFVSSGGGVPVLIREEANDPHWAPDSDRLVFTANDGIRTIRKDGSGETLVSNFGQEPVYARNGKYIAFTDGKDIWKIRVNGVGSPLGTPSNITTHSTTVFSNHPSWSHNSKTIVSSTTGLSTLDLQTIPASGGTHTLLIDLNMEDDFDPCYSKNGKKIAFSGRTNSPPEVESIKSNILAVSLQNHPNPFSHTTNIRYQIDQDGYISLRIFDQSGKLVSTLFDGFQLKGQYQTTWDGSASNGSPLANGIYLYQLKTNKKQVSKQLILFR